MLNIKKIKLLGNYILTTKNEYDGKTTENGVIIPKGNLKEYQQVVAVGPTVRTISVGDLVSVNPKNYAVFKYKKGSLKGDIEDMQQVKSYNFNVVKMDKVDYLLLTDQDIDFIIEDYEELSNIIIPEQKIIL
jgi:co-chaperonin GroES (HSP10)